MIWHTVHNKTYQSFWRYTRAVPTWRYNLLGFHVTIKAVQQYLEPNEFALAPSYVATNQSAHRYFLQRYLCMCLALAFKTLLIKGIVFTCWSSSSPLRVVSEAGFCDTNRPFATSKHARDNSRPLRGKKRWEIQLEKITFTVMPRSLSTWSLSRDCATFTLFVLPVSRSLSARVDFPWSICAMNWNFGCAPAQKRQTCPRHLC